MPSIYVPFQTNVPVVAVLYAPVYDYVVLFTKILHLHLSYCDDASALMSIDLWMI